MLDMTEPVSGSCNCENEGWCALPGTSKFRISLPFNDDHTIVFPSSIESPEDRIVANHHTEFERKPGSFAFLWGTSNMNQSVPEQSATAFPISPVVGGSVIWASTRHSCDPYAHHVGFYAKNNAFFRVVKDRVTPFNKLPLNRTSHDPSVFTCAIDAALLFKLPDTTAADADFALYTANINPGFFWIPDPTPLQVGNAVAVLGNPGAFGSRASGDMALRFLETLFIPGTKSISSGNVVGISGSVVCHDASTIGGFCGAVGVNINTSAGFKFSFIHAGSHPKFDALFNPVRHNHGVSVNDPDFKSAYVTHVIPLLQQARATLSQEQIAAIKAYHANF